MQLGYGVWLQQLATVKPTPVQVQDQPVAQVGSARDDGSRRGQIVVALPGNDPGRSVLKRMRHRDIRIACGVATDITGRRGAEKGRRYVPRVPEVIGAGAASAHLERSKQSGFDELGPRCSGCALDDFPREPKHQVAIVV